MLVENVLIGHKMTDIHSNLDQSLLKNSTYIGRASGRSMEGVGIFDGDLLIIDRAVEVKNNDVIVSYLNGLFVCKIADLINNQLLSASPEYKAVKLTEFDDYCVEGVVVQSIRMHRTHSSLGLNTL